MERNLAPFAYHQAMKLIVALVVTIAPMAGASAAVAQNVEDPPEGYEFCGWQDFSDRSWTYEQPEPGAYLVGFADGMSCRSARRNISRVNYTRRPPYRPIRTGYRCKTLDSEHEFSDVRCVKVGGERKFRFRTGA